MCILLPYSKGFVYSNNTPAHQRCYSLKKTEKDFNSFQCTTKSMH